MCGICGFIDFTGPAERHILEPMVRVLRRRGPDDSGYYCDGSTALGHARLSIIDVASGHQPLFNEDESIVLIQNGEFYNYVEIRDELMAKGHTLRTRSDAEVLIHLYEEKGAEAVRLIHGMFAFALYDRRKKIILLGRDRMGKKPLYYSLTPEAFVFASELKSLVLHPKTKKNIDSRSMLSYFFYDYVPGTDTIYEGIRKLGAGCIAEIDLEKKTLSERPYWDIPLFDSGKSDTFETAKERLRLLLEDAVRRRLRSDVPIGVFLSGGVDSSIVTHLMKKLTAQSNIHTFSVGFHERSYDESRYSILVSGLLQTEHHHHILNDTEALETLREVKDHMDEPFADPSLLPTFHLSKMARQFVKVVLGGEGGDELFAGYQVFHLLKVMSLLGRAGSSLELLCRALQPFLPASEKYDSWASFCQRFIPSFAIKEEVPRLLSLFGSFSLGDLSLLTGKQRKDAESIVLSGLRIGLDKRTGEDAMTRLQYALARYYLGDGVLVKVDRASMANGLEVRSPILDTSVVEYAFSSIPPHFKLSGMKTKHILREAFSHMLPPAIAYRKKKGFAMPLASWLRTCFREEVLSRLNKKTVSSQGLLNPGFVDTLVQEHLQGKKDHRKKIWSLLMFQYWMEKQ